MDIANREIPPIKYLSPIEIYQACNDVSSSPIT